MDSGLRSAFSGFFLSPSWRLVLVAGTLALVAVFMAGPVLFTLGDVLESLLTAPAATLEDLASLDRRLFLLLAGSVLFALAVTVASLLLGLLLTAAAWRARTPWPGRLRWVLLALLAVPSYVHALAWSGFLHRCNLLLEQRGLPQLPEQGWAVAWLVQTMTLAPLAVGGCMLALECVDARLVRAARSLRSDLAVLATVVLPPAAPVLLATGALLFLLSVGDYSVPSLFQAPVHAMHIFAVFSARADAGQAFLAALPLLAVMALALLSRSSS